jgi:hypothetical protein
MNNSSRGLFYLEYKRGFGIEKYLVKLISYDRVMIAKFRCNNIKFPIETGRWNGVTIIVCSLFDKTRQDKILFIQPQTHMCTSGHSKFTFYMNTNSHVIYAIQHHKIINK